MSGSVIGAAGLVDCVDAELVSVVEKVAGAEDTVKVYFASNLFTSANSGDSGLKFILIG
jgi:hypothetical protein